MQALVPTGCRSPSNTREVQATFNLSWSDRLVTNKHQRQHQGSLHCNLFAIFFWKAWNSYVTLTLILTTLAAGWLGSCACVCRLVATSGSRCNTTGVRVGCWSTTPDKLSKVLSTFRSLPSSMAILSSHGMQFQITSNPEQPTIQLSSSYIKLTP